MGTCCFPKNNIIYRKDSITNTKNYFNINEEIYEEFTDMPEVNENKYVNYGIKRMKAYICNLNIDELNNLREKFWKNKITLNERYKYLRQAVLYDSNKCEDYLLKNGFTVINGCVNKCTDDTKFIYSIPNYCINDPYFEKELEKIDSKRERNKINVNLKIGDLKEKFIFYDDVSGKEIKEEYVKRKNLNSDYVSKIRLFFGGNEIHEKDLLYQHKIKDNYTIQININ